jgi:hypothetical protein
MRHLFRLSLSLTALIVILALSASAASAEEHAFVGTKNCKKCHIKQYKSWAETKMAQTFETLKPGERAEAKTAAGLDPDKDYTTDPECLVCHVVGYGKEGGYTSVEETPDHVGVGCEMCHGAGGTYTQDGKMTLKNKEYKRSEIVAAGMVEKVGVEQCQQCHNTDSPFVGDDYVFDFATRKDEGTHENIPLKYPHE